jgi:hypothetical protein
MKPKQKKRSITKILLLPILAITFLTGFILSTVGEPKENRQRNVKAKAPRAYNFEMQIAQPEVLTTKN